MLDHEVRRRRESNPPATISDPDATEPSTVTSPFGKMTVWPERTGVAISNEVGSSCTQCWRVLLLVLIVAAVPKSSGLKLKEVAKRERVVEHRPPQARSRVCRARRVVRRDDRCRCDLSLSALRSSTIGLPLKKPGEFRAQLSSLASQSMIGASRRQNRMRCTSECKIELSYSSRSRCSRRSSCSSCSRWRVTPEVDRDG